MSSHLSINVLSCFLAQYFIRSISIEELCFTKHKMSFIIFTKWKDAAWNIKPNCPAASFIWFIPPARKPASKEASTECARNPINYGDFNQFWKIGKHIDPFWHSLHCSLFFVSSAFERRGKRPNEIFPKSPKFYFRTSVTRLDNFWKFLTTNLLIKCGKKIGDFLENLENYYSKYKLMWVLFGQL